MKKLRELWKDICFAWNAIWQEISEYDLLLLKKEARKRGIEDVTKAPEIGSMWVVDEPDPVKLIQYMNFCPVRVSRVERNKVHYCMGAIFHSSASSSVIHFNFSFIPMVKAIARTEQYLKDKGEGRVCDAERPRDEAA